MIHIDWVYALVGGAIIGLSVSLMLLWNGRVTGISGIIGGALSYSVGDFAWRVLFVLGLVSGGLALSFFHPVMFTGTLDTSTWTLVAAGLLVGFGTSLGSGCTSGHGVCGISRLSPRSLVATIVFMVAGIASVVAFRALGVFS